MITFNCTEVGDGWKSVLIPDELDVTFQIDQTTHTFYAALSELIRVYDAIVREREGVFGIGTGGYVQICTEDVADDTMKIELAPIRFNAERGVLIERLEALLEEIFEGKDEMSTQEEQERGLEMIQSWLDNRGGNTDVHALYAELVGDDGE